MANFMQEHRVLVITGESENRIHAKDGEGNDISISKTVLSRYRNTQVTETRETTRTAINELIKTNLNVLMQVKCTKEIKAKVLMDLINNPAITARTQKEAQELVKGEPRILTGVCKGLDSNGNFSFIEYVQEGDSYIKQPRIIKASNIVSLILNGIKWQQR